MEILVTLVYTVLELTRVFIFIIVFNINLTITKSLEKIFQAFLNFKVLSMKTNKEYWNKNLLYLKYLLFFWFIVSFGAGILFKDFLNSIYLGGFPLGFWFAQQGSVYVFVILIFIYVFLMNKLDKSHGYDE